jgi:NAD(P)-dependent dehydrogenase (short-subunit alcohol dehydrogenase family)
MRNPSPFLPSLIMWKVVLPIAVVGASAVWFRRYVQTGSPFGNEVYAPRIDLAGKLCLVTGANIGIGKETARAFAKNGAKVIIAVRSADRGRAAREDIVRSTGCSPSAVEVLSLDLASLASVRSFVSEMKRRGSPIHILVNNAGMMSPNYSTTADGFEIMLGALVPVVFVLFMRRIDSVLARHESSGASVADNAATGCPTDCSNGTHRVCEFGGRFLCTQAH